MCYFYNLLGQVCHRGPTEDLYGRGRNGAKDGQRCYLERLSQHKRFFNRIWFWLFDARDAGEFHTNMPADLHMEHCNKEAKEDISSARGWFWSKMLRLSFLQAMSQPK